MTAQDNFCPGQQTKETRSVKMDEQKAKRGARGLVWHPKCEDAQKATPPAWQLQDMNLMDLCLFHCFCFCEQLSGPVLHDFELTDCLGH